jgi:hypothetical protein
MAPKSTPRTRLLWPEIAVEKASCESWHLLPDEPTVVPCLNWLLLFSVPEETEVIVFYDLNRIVRICREINAFRFLKFWSEKRQDADGQNSCTESVRIAVSRA